MGICSGVVQYAFNVPNDHSNEQKHVRRGLFQIVQLIVDELFLIGSAAGKKWTSLGPSFYLFLSFGKFVSSALIVCAAKEETPL